MYHPQPQHPPSARRYFGTEFLDNRSSSRTKTSNVRSSQPVLINEDQQVQAIVESPQYDMSVHPPMPPLIDARSSETCTGHQMSPNRHQAVPPTFALRPVNAPMAFSHIEYPNMSPGQSRQPYNYASKPQNPAATVYHSLQPKTQPDHARQLSYESSGIGSPDSQGFDQSSLYASPDRSRTSSSAYDYAAEPMDRQETMKPVIRRRTRGDSNSSAASLWSSVAASGEANYRNDLLHNETNPGSYNGEPHRDTIPPSDAFQSQSLSISYSYQYATAPRDGLLPVLLVGNVGGDFPSPSMDVDPPCVPVELQPTANEIGLQAAEHPFDCGNANWDIPFGAPSAASTDGDAFSLHSQEQTSSRGSSEPSSGPARRSRRGKSSEVDASRRATPARRETSGEGKKKTVMACHFCRFRKLRCDGGHPCSHCDHRHQECTYDTKVRRRGPGRKNKSAQETALVQLANRQRQEAERERSSQKFGRRTGQETATEGLPVFRDASSQTSPRPKQYASRSESNFPSYPVDNSQYQSRVTQGLSPRSQEHQTFPTSVPGSYDREFEASRYAREWEEYDMPPMPSVRQREDDHRRTTSGPVTYESHTPVTQAPSSFYEGSPDRSSSQPQQGQYASANGYGYNSNSNRYSIATQGGETTYSHTDSESAYAYSEGANVMPSGYSYERYHSSDNGPSQRSEQEGSSRRVTVGGIPSYADEAGNYTGRMVDNCDAGQVRMGRYGMRR